MYWIAYSMILYLSAFLMQVEINPDHQQVNFHSEADSLKENTIHVPALIVMSPDTVIDDGLKAGWEDGSFFLSSRDEVYRLTIGGRVQSRYEYLNRSAEEAISSFYLRRVRLDLHGEFMNGRVTWRIMPEMARTANLRDGWIDYKISSMVNLRAGQFVVPFQWLRFISGNRQHFAERGSASEDFFGAPGGYDIGVGLHGRNEKNTLAYGVGLFDGAGRNVKESNSAGHMVSGRINWAIRGNLPREEPDLKYSEHANWMLAAGLQSANKNEVREWDLGRSVTGNRRADWMAATADVVLHWRGLSVISTSYIRQVNPDDDEVNTYTGWGHTISTGYFIMPQKAELVARFSRSINDRDITATQQTDWGIGLNIYHFGHNLKTKINYENLNREVAGADDVFLIELHMQF